MKKRVISILLSCVLTVGLLAACGNNNSNVGNQKEQDNKSSQESSKVEEKVEAKEDPTKLVWVLPIDPQDGLDEVLAVLNPILEEKINVELEMQFLGSTAYGERMNMNMTAGSDWDLCFTCNWGGLCDYAGTVGKGGFLCIDDYIANDEEFKALVPDYAWEGSKIDGSIYAVPNLQTMASAPAFSFNKEAVEKYGLDTSKVKSWFDLDEFFADFFAGEEYGYLPTYSNWTNSNTFFQFYPKYEAILMGAGIVVDYDTTEAYSIWEDKDVVLNIIEKRAEYIEKGYKPENEILDPGSYASRPVADGAVWNESKFPGAEAFTVANYGFEPVLVQVGKKLISTSSIICTMTGINAQSENPDKAVELLKLLFTDEEVFRLVAYGIEGTHYNIEDGVRVVVEGSNYNHPWDWGVGNTFLGYPLPGQDLDILEQVEEDNNTAEASSLLGFVADTSGLVTEISNIGAVATEYENLIYGLEKDPEAKYEEFIKAVKAAGLDKVVEEINAQIDAWEASK